jgi:hypothetical protein
MPDEGSEREPPPSPWSTLGRYSGHGFTIAGAIGLFMAVGWWLDGKVGLRPLLTILGAFLGGAAGFYAMWRDLVVGPRGPGDGPQP